MGASSCRTACSASKETGDRISGEDEAKLVVSDSFSMPEGASSSNSSPSKPPKKNRDEEYSILIDKGAGPAKLGIDVDYVAESESLPIRAIMPGGLVEMWNTAHPDVPVDKYDHIVEVNGERQVVDLLMERLQADSTLKITLRRVGYQLQAVCELGPRGKTCHGAAEQGSAVAGTVRLTQISSTICRIEYEIRGLTPGKHGFHIHEKADFSDGCASAGPIYNPFRKTDGGPESEERHVGDLGNVEADRSGLAQGVIMDHLVKLEGETSVIGRSFMVHADPDDLGKGRQSLACGEIKLPS
jgi:Cu-Zn family superoxide dismutase